MYVDDSVHTCFFTTGIRLREYESDFCRKTKTSVSVERFLRVLHCSIYKRFDAQ